MEFTVSPSFVSKYVQSSIAYNRTALEPWDVTPYHWLFQERGTILRLQLYKRVRISQAEVYER